MLNILVNNCEETGVLEFGYYGGKGSNGTVSCALTSAMKDDGLLTPSAVGIRPVASCDSDQNCVNLMKHMFEADGRPVWKHLFGDFKNRMKHDHLRHIQSLEVPQDCSRSVSVDSHLEQARYLREAVDAKDFFDDSGMDHCYVCDKMCPILDMTTDQEQQGFQQAPQDSQHLVDSDSSCDCEVVSSKGASSSAKPMASGTMGINTCS